MCQRCSRKLKTPERPEDTEEQRNRHRLVFSTMFSFRFFVVTWSPDLYQHGDDRMMFMFV